MKHVMVDLETLGLTPNSVILSIGAVKFDPRTGEIGGGFERKIDIGSSIARGFTINVDTLQWWSNQSLDARTATFDGGKVRIPDALASFSEFFGDSVYIWGNGADFDIAMLKTAYERLGADTPWNYKNTRCYRTMMSEFGEPSDYVKPTLAHRALPDAISQAATLNKLFARQGWKTPRSVAAV